LGEDALAAKTALDVAAQAVVDAFARRMGVEQMTFALIGLARRSPDPNAIARTHADALSAEAGGPLAQGGERAPLLHEVPIAVRAESARPSGLDGRGEVRQRSRASARRRAGVTSAPRGRWLLGRRVCHEQDARPARVGRHTITYRRMVAAPSYRASAGVSTCCACTIKTTPESSARHAQTY
jgi:hypothetical protein